MKSYLYKFSPGETIEAVNPADYLIVGKMKRGLVVRTPQPTEAKPYRKLYDIKWESGIDGHSMRPEFIEHNYTSAGQEFDRDLKRMLE